MEKDNTNSFNTPEGYFESFNDRLMDRIQKEEANEVSSIIPKTDGFLVPDGYLEKFSSHLITNTIQKKSKVIPLWSKPSFYYGAAAIAAIFLIAYGIIWTTGSEHIQFDDLATSEIEAYLEDHTSNLSSYEIAEVVSLEHMELSDILEEDLKTEAILEYLDENVDEIEIEDLNLEYIDYE